MAANDESILTRLQDIIPPADEIARALKVELETAKRLHKLALIHHAALVESSEQANQAVLSSRDSIEANSDQIATQGITVKKVEAFTNDLASAATIVKNVGPVYMRYDDKSIRHVLADVDLDALKRAAQSLPLIRLSELINILLDAKW